MKKLMLIILIGLITLPVNSLTSEVEKVNKVNHNLKSDSSKVTITDYAFARYLTVKYLKKYSYDEYVEGFEDGYCEGWRDYHITNNGLDPICPVAPLAPVPYLGRDTYLDGYNRGLKQVM